MTGLNTMTKKCFRSNGKLLLSGEYVILEGGLGLGLPCKYGQTLDITPLNEPIILWKAIDCNNKLWFTTTLSVKDLIVLETSNTEITATLVSFLKVARNLNQRFLNSQNGFLVETVLEFEKNWGLGSSSTLINNIAQWANVDAYTLLWNAFKGSGYDIACAQHNTPITFQLKKNNQHTSPIVKKVDFKPPFHEQLFFIYLNKKQNSRQGITHYQKRSYEKNTKLLVNEISKVTLKMLQTRSLKTFEMLLDKHETIIGNFIGLTPVKSNLFSDFKGSIKSLGAWGGDFILATGNESYVTNYFNQLGYQTILSYQHMIL